MKERDEMKKCKRCGGVDNEHCATCPELTDKGWEITASPDAWLKVEWQVDGPVLSARGGTISAMCLTCRSFEDL